MYNIAPVSAPFPTDFARKGNVLYHTKYIINPTIGKKNPRMAKPIEGASCVKYGLGKLEL